MCCGTRSKSAKYVHEYNSPLFYGNLIVAKKAKNNLNKSDSGAVPNQLTSPLNRKKPCKEELCIAQPGESDNTSMLSELSNLRNNKPITQLQKFID